MRKKQKIFLEMLARELYSSNIERRASAFEQDLILQKKVAIAIENTGRKIEKNKHCNSYDSKTFQMSYLYRKQ